jgi:hypothetical protein
MGSQRTVSRPRGRTDPHRPSLGHGSLRTRTAVAVGVGGIGVGIAQGEMEMACQAPGVVAVAGERDGREQHFRRRVRHRGTQAGVNWARRRRRAPARESPESQNCRCSSNTQCHSPGTYRRSGSAEGCAVSASGPPFATRTPRSIMVGEGHNHRAAGGPDVPMATHVSRPTDTGDQSGAEQERAVRAMETEPRQFWAGTWLVRIPHLHRRGLHGIDDLLPDGRKTSKGPSRRARHRHAERMTCNWSPTGVTRRGRWGQRQN